MSLRFVDVACALGLVAGAGAVPVRAETHYLVRLHTGAWTGRSAALVFDWVCADSVPNRLDVVDFQDDGRRRVALVHADPRQGDLGLDPVVHPARLTSLGSRLFHSWMSVPFDSLGRAVQFTLRVSEHRGPPARPSDMFTFSVAPGPGVPRFDTADPLGVNALFCLEVSGAEGGQLTVFPPARLIEPDTIEVVLPRAAPSERPRR
jgi:hypothetical protein